MDTVSRTFDSVVEIVDGAEDIVRQFALGAGFDDADTYFICLAVREVLVNAIKHGNHYDRSKKVGLRMSKREDGIEIVVSDQGTGFHLGEVPDPLLPENMGRTSGRGVKIALSVMDELHVDNHSERGTHVRLIKRFPHLAAEAS